MSSNTKIVVLRSKELVYALVLLVVSVLIIMVAVSLFMPAEDDTATPPTPAIEEESTEESSIPDTDTSSLPDTYVPGIYTSSLQLGNSNVELQITVDKDHINSITMTNIAESVATLYPLMSPTLSELSAVILEQQSVDNISYTEENRYTSMLLMQAITTTLDKARVSESADVTETSTIY